jgi:hypothetical protein
VSQQDDLNNKFERVIASEFRNLQSLKEAQLLKNLNDNTILDLMNEMFNYVPTTGTDYGNLTVDQFKNLLQRISLHKNELGYKDRLQKQLTANDIKQLKLDSDQLLDQVYNLFVQEEKMTNVQEDQPKGGFLSTLFSRGSTPSKNIQDSDQKTRRSTNFAINFKKDQNQLIDQSGSELVKIDSDAD